MSRLIVAFFCSLFLTVTTARVHALAFATFNVKNLAPDDPPARFTRLAEAIALRMLAPEIVAVQEICDSDGARDSGRSDAGATYALLLAALARAGAPDYRVVQLDPEDGADGGLPGANIRVAFLVRGLKAPTTPVLLQQNPVRLGSHHPAFAATRKPLLAELELAGRPLLLFNLHLSSRRGQDGPAGDDKRLAQAELVAAFAAGVLRARPDSYVAVLGDLNSDLGEAPLAALTAIGLEPLLARVPAERRHTYVFAGRPSSLDHILASPALARRLDSVRVLHELASFAGGALSDHAPVLVTTGGSAADLQGGCSTAATAAAPCVPVLPALLVLLALGNLRPPRPSRPGQAPCAGPDSPHSSRNAAARANGPAERRDRAT